MRAARAALAAALGLLLAACGARTRPNVLLVVLDTARADRFSFDGYARDTSPRIAAFAAEGAVYERAYTPAPWTLPAHASLFTGLFPSAHGADSGHLRLDDEHVTLAEAFLAAGYHTVAYTANPWVGKSYHFDQGFETYEEVWRNRDEADQDAGAAQVNRKVRHWLEWRAVDPQASRRPFFLFINYLEPHLPYDPPEPERSRFLPSPGRGEAVDRMRRFQKPEDVRFNVGLTNLSGSDLDLLSALYDGEIAYLDRRAGELFDLLRGHRLLDRTVVVITSDHGESLGEHHLLDHKLSVYDNLLRIPLVVRYPAVVRAGQRIQAPVMLQDLYPTLLRLAGIEPPAPVGAPSAPAPPAMPSEAALLPGVSLVGGIVPASGSAADGPRESAPLVAEFARPVQFLDMMQEVLVGADLSRWDHALVAWRVGNEKLQWSSDGRHRLFDLAHDPGEERDLASERPDRVALLTQQVEAWLRRPAARPPLGLSRSAD